MKATSEIPTQTLTFACKCGRVHVMENIRHYDRIILECGRAVWALQPKRDGDLKLFPWPGPALTAREMAAKESAAQTQPA